MPANTPRRSSKSAAAYFNDGNADCSGGKENQVWEVTERDKLEVLRASAASSISAGGNLNLLGDSINNASSVISAGQNLYANVASLSNEGVVTGETETLRVLRSSGPATTPAAATRPRPSPTSTGSTAPTTSTIRPRWPTH
ncbi:MAG: hypothetical protein QM805_19670 [Pseudomonas sp.]